MPAIFIGHGSLMNAIEDTPYSRAWRALGASLPKPRAILCVSAHYYRRGTAATANDKPPTIHDFGNFPRKLHEMLYPAPGDPALAEEAARLLAPTPVELDRRWGLDHGSWSILTHMYPNADVPVVELAVDEDKSPEEHFDLGAKLAPLRDDGVLGMATGNVVHNLERFTPRMKGAYDWGERFDSYIRTSLESNDRAALVNYERHPDAALAAPDRDHFLPILYVAALRRPDEALSWVVDGGLEMGAISMRAFRVG